MEHKETVAVETEDELVVPEVTKQLLNLDMFDENYLPKSFQETILFDKHPGENNVVKSTVNPFAGWENLIRLLAPMKNFAGVVFTGETNLLSAVVVNNIIYRGWSIYRRETEGSDLIDITSEFNYVAPKLVDLLPEFPLTLDEIEAYEKRVKDAVLAAQTDLVEVPPNVAGVVTKGLISFLLENETEMIVMANPEDETAPEQDSVFPVKNLPENINMPLDSLVKFCGDLLARYNFALTREEAVSLINDFATPQIINANGALSNNLFELFVSKIRAMGDNASRIMPLRVFVDKEPCELPADATEEQINAAKFSGNFVMERTEESTLPEIRFMFNGNEVGTDQLNMDFDDKEPITYDNLITLIRYVWFSPFLGQYGAMNSNYEIVFEGKTMWVKVEEIQREEPAVETAPEAPAEQ